MRRENKLALIVGFSVLLVVAVLVSDHLSTARQEDVPDGLNTLLDIPGGRAFVEAPLRTEPPRIATRPSTDDESFVTGASRDAGSGIATGPVSPGYRSIVPQDIVPDRRAGGPIEIENGSAVRGVESPPARGGIAGITGIDSDKIRKWLGGTKTVLVEPGEGTPEDEPRSVITPGNDRPTARPAINGHIPHENKYVIQPNDTLFEVCERFYGDGTKWRELVKINEGRIREDGTVYPDVTIDLIPGADLSRAQTPASAADRPVPSERGTRSYTVKKGDTLSEIVEREVGSVRHLARVRELNPWLETQKDKIRVDQKLTLPVLRQRSARAH